MNYYSMTYEEYEDLPLLNRLILWQEIDSSLIKKFWEFDYKRKQIEKLKESQ